MALNEGAAVLLRRSEVNCHVNARAGKTEVWLETAIFYADCLLKRIFDIDGLVSVKTDLSDGVCFNFT